LQIDSGAADAQASAIMTSSAARLEALTRDLRAKWRQTKEAWADAKSQEFEQRFLQELFPGVDKAVAIIEQIDKLINKIKKDCE
jgi:hypothetical protein